MLFPHIVNVAATACLLSVSRASVIPASTGDDGPMMLDVQPRGLAVRQVGHPPPPPTCDGQASSMIQDKQTALSGKLGPLQGNMKIIAPCQGYSQKTAYGAVYYVTGTSEAYAVYGAIYIKYFALGEQSSPLGYPVKDEDDALNGGRYSRFSNGSIYWKLNFGANSLWGPMHDTWASKGYEASTDLGYPIRSLEWDPTGGLEGNGQLVSVACKRLMRLAMVTTAVI